MWGVSNHWIQWKMDWNSGMENGIKRRRGIASVTVLYHVTSSVLAVYLECTMHSNVVCEPCDL